MKDENLAEQGIDEDLIDKNVKWYINMKIRVLKKKLRFFIWISEHPGWSAIIFVILISCGIWISHRISVTQVIEATTGVKVETENIHK